MTEKVNEMASVSSSVGIFETASLRRCQSSDQFSLPLKSLITGKLSGKIFDFNDFDR